MKIINGLVWEKDRTFSKKNMAIFGSRLIDDVPQTDDASRTEEVIDATDLYVIPGLIDIHFHGCGGYDFCDGISEALQTIAEKELSWGITAICPASMTLSEERLGEIFDNAATFKGNSKGADLVGINMEGPFLSKAKIGAQNPQYLHKLDVDMFKRLQAKAHGLIKLVDIAPELEGADDFIDALKDQVHISLAHTNATYAEATKALQKGADHVIHMYNGMSAFTHREPGVVGAACDAENIYAELICDGIHLHPATVRATFKMLGPEKIVLISDSMEACGLQDGNYALGGQSVTVKGNKAVITGTDTIAGSVTNLMDCLRWTVQVANIPLADAVYCATYNAAKSIGIEGDYGSLEIGKYADLVLLDKELQVKAIVKDGRLI